MKWNSQAKERVLKKAMALYKELLQNDISRHRWDEIENSIEVGIVESQPLYQQLAIQTLQQTCVGQNDVLIRYVNDLHLLLQAEQRCHQQVSQAVNVILSVCVTLTIAAIGLICFVLFGSEVLFSIGPQIMLSMPLTLMIMDENVGAMVASPQFSREMQEQFATEWEHLRAPVANPVMGEALCDLPQGDTENQTEQKRVDEYITALCSQDPNTLDMRHILPLYFPWRFRNPQLPLAEASRVSEDYSGARIR